MPYVVVNAPRAKILTGLKDIFNKCVYIDKHINVAHGFKTHYIELYVPVENGNNIYRFHLTSKEIGYNSNAFTVQKALFYNLKKKDCCQGQPQEIPELHINWRTVLLLRLV